MYGRESDSSVQIVQDAYGGDGAIRIHRFFPETTTLSARVAVWEIAPGASEGSHAHGDDRPLEEIYYFLEGDGVMSFDGEEVSVAAGDAVLAPEGVDHGLRNTGDGPMKLVIVWGPPVTGDRRDR